MLLFGSWPSKEAWLYAFIISNLCVCVCIRVCMCLCVMCISVWCGVMCVFSCKGQRMASGSWFSPSATWVPGIELRLLVQVAGVFPRWGITPSHCLIFERRSCSISQTDFELCCPGYPGQYHLLASGFQVLGLQESCVMPGSWICLCPSFKVYCFFLVL